MRLQSLLWQDIDSVVCAPVIILKRTQQFPPHLVDPLLATVSVMPVIQSSHVPALLLGFFEVFLLLLPGPVLQIRHTPRARFHVETVHTQALPHVVVFAPPPPKVVGVAIHFLVHPALHHENTTQEVGTLVSCVLGGQVPRRRGTQFSGVLRQQVRVREQVDVVQTDAVAVLALGQQHPDIQQCPSIERPRTALLYHEHARLGQIALEAREKGLELPPALGLRRRAEWNDDVEDCV